MTVSISIENNNDIFFYIVKKNDKIVLLMEVHYIPINSRNYFTQNFNLCFNLNLNLRDKENNILFDTKGELTIFPDEIKRNIWHLRCNNTNLFPLHYMKQYNIYVPTQFYYFPEYKYTRYYPLLFNESGTLLNNLNLYNEFHLLYISNQLNYYFPTNNIITDEESKDTDETDNRYNIKYSL